MGLLTEEQRSQPALCAKTLRAAGLFAPAFVARFLQTAAGISSLAPRLERKSLAAGPFLIFNRLFAPARISAFRKLLKSNSVEIF